jgi:hypothetical protein
VADSQSAWVGLYYPANSGEKVSVWELSQKVPAPLAFSLYLSWRSSLLQAAERDLHEGWTWTAFGVRPLCAMKQLWKKTAYETIQVVHSIVANSDACVHWRYLECGVELRHVAPKVLSQGMFGMLVTVRQLLKAH